MVLLCPSTAPLCFLQLAGHGKFGPDRIAGHESNLLKHYNVYSIDQRARLSATVEDIATVDIVKSGMFDAGAYLKSNYGRNACIPGIATKHEIRVEKVAIPALHSSSSSSVRSVPSQFAVHLCYRCMPEDKLVVVVNPWVGGAKAKITGSLTANKLLPDFGYVCICNASVSF